MQVIIDRIIESDSQTYGVLIIGNRPRFVTLEEAWRDNQRKISCIPPGIYTCVEHESPKFGWTYLVTDVPDRSDILFHPGNTALDTEGCILVGSSFNPDLGAAGITNSKIAFMKFLRLLRNEKSFQLVIQGVPT